MEFREVIVEVWNGSDVGRVVKLDMGEVLDVVGMVLVKVVWKVRIKRMVRVVEIGRKGVGCDRRVRDIEVVQVSEGIDGVR